MSILLIVVLVVGILCSGGLLEWGTRPAARRRGKRSEHREGNTLFALLLISCAVAAVVAVALYR